MQTKCEIEYKVLLNREQFNLLLDKYPNCTTIKQNNIYFDTNPSLKDRGMGCRIRVIENRFIFTLKIKRDKGHDEIEFDIPSLSLNHPQVKDVLLSQNIEGLTEVGSLFTTRHFVELENAELCIDENTYNGIIDYEVEYELKDATVDTKDEFLQILNSVNIPYIPNKNSKIKRCLESKKHTTQYTF